MLFSVSGAEGYIPKTIQPEKYRHFWQNYEKVSPPGMTRIRQKADRLTEDFRRRFTGEFYANITHTSWLDWKIETWDVGYYQVRNAMKGLGGRVSSRADAADGDIRPPAENLREAHDALRAKLLPQIYSLGFLNPDVEYYE